MGLSFNAGSDDVRDAPSARIISALNEMGYTNILVYDPVAMENFRAQYDLACRYAKGYDELVGQAGVIAIVTAWPEFKDVTRKTDVPVVDCRYMLDETENAGEPK